jgi:hypothetical protein
MSEYKLFGTASEQEKELINILINSSLYRDMNPEDKHKLLGYLVSSYFNIIQKESRVQPVVIQYEPALCVRS